jgi:hypothetical protein
LKWRRFAALSRLALLSGWKDSVVPMKAMAPMPTQSMQARIRALADGVRSATRGL